MTDNNTSDIAKRIREGNLKRKEQERKKQQLEQEYNEVLTGEKMEEDQSRSATRFLPSILIFLLFVSFPLSEREVDWYLVSIFGLLNALLVCILKNPAEWFSIVCTIFLNFVLIRFSSELYMLPQRVAQVPPLLLFSYVAANWVTLLAAYFFYVNPHTALFSRERETALRRSTPSQSAGHHAGEADALEVFALEKAKAERLDLLLCMLLLLNVAALVYLDVLPLQLVVRNGLSFLRHLQ